MSTHPDYNDDALRIMRQRAGDHDDRAWADLLHALAVRQDSDERTPYERRLTRHLLELLSLSVERDTGPSDDQERIKTLADVRAALTGGPKLVGKSKNVTRDAEIVQAVDVRLTLAQETGELLSLQEAQVAVAKLAGVSLITVRRLYRAAKGHP